MSSGVTPRAGAKPNFRYIDCARGYAVLMVITCHLTFQLPNLPYPIHRLTAMGWWGVELFFLASCVTLLMSWHHEAARNGAADPRAFFIRRFFRIAPAYYAAAAFYFFLLPPSSGLDARQLLAAMLFINAWHPVLTPTVLDGWNVVPGGWSISVEFCFYLIFPFFAAWTTSFARACALAIASIVIAVIANRAAYTVLSGTYDPIGLGNFLFFWPPNQFPVFALGGVLFFLLRQTANPRGQTFLASYGTAAGLTAILSFSALSYVSLGHYFGDGPSIPGLLAVTIPLMGFILALSSNRGILVNRYAAAMGKVSFSAYLLHYAVLHAFERWPETFHSHAEGFTAIAVFALGWIFTVSVTYGLAWLAYRFIESPFIDIGKSLISPTTVRSPAPYSPPPE